MDLTYDLVFADDKGVVALHVAANKNNATIARMLINANARWARSVKNSEKITCVSSKLNLI